MSRADQPLGLMSALIQLPWLPELSPDGESDTGTISITVNPHILDTDSWFLIAQSKRMHGLTSYVRVPVKMAPRMQDPFTGNWIYKIRFRQSWGAWMWQGTFGSQGA